MSHRRNPLVCLGACLVFLVSGALNRQLLLSHQTEGFPSRPLTAPTPDFQPAEESAADFRKRLLAAWEPAGITWLEIRSRQRQHLGEMPFTAETRLVLGPGGCVHRLTDVRTGRSRGRCLVVCDGKILAESRTYGTAQPQVLSEPLGVEPHSSVARKKLEERGCIGPHVGLARLMDKLREVRSTTGKLEGRDVVCIMGKIAAPALDPEGPPELLAHRQVRLLVERESLVPLRVEWWLEGPDGQASRLLLEVDYLEVKKDQPLSREECIRLFSLNSPSS